MRLSGLKVGLMVGILGISSAHAASTPGLRVGILAGVTYLKNGASSSVTYSGGSYSSSTKGKMGYPLLGIGVVATTGRFALRSYLESQKYASTYSYSYQSTTGSTGSYGSDELSDVVSFTSIPSIYLIKNLLYTGIGGGVGYQRVSGGRITYPWLTTAIGFDFNKWAFLEIRPQFDLSQQKLMSVFYVPVVLGILFFDASK